MINLLAIFFIFNKWAISQEAVIEIKSDSEKNKMVKTNSPQTDLNLKDLELFNKVLYLVESQYYQKVDSSKLIQSAIKGMMSSLDPHTSYLDAELYKKMESDTNGEFGGIGIEVTVKDNTILVVTTIEDTPAFKAGIRAGDKIIQVNKVSVIGLSMETVIDKMKGKVGETIQLGVIRDGKEGKLDFSVKRSIIKIRAVKSTLLEDNFAYLRLTQFQRKVADNISEALKDLSKQAEKKGGIKGIILDLRANPGGLLDQAVDVSSRFLASGDVVSTEDRNGKIIDIKKVIPDVPKDTKTPMVVLVNGSSASASEIVAGALQDQERAIIMGATTFGKGSVQSLIPLDNKSAVKMTIAQYLTPLKRRIQAIGIKPDIEFDEYDAKWVKENKKRPKFLRERDLGNHLLGEGEKIESAISENSEKIAKDDKNSKEEKLDSKLDPMEDFQIVQAVNYLKGMKIFKEKKVII